MRLAAFVQPHVGGTFTHWQRMRRGLAPHGVDLLWLGAGEEAARALVDPRWEDVRGQGIVVEGGSTPRATVAGVVEEIRRQQLDGIVVNVLGDPVLTTVARHLPAALLRILVVHNITPGTYAAARAIRDHVHVAVGVSPRIRDDLVAAHGFAAERTVCVPNAADHVASPRPGQRPRPPRLLYLGRIEEDAKGVLWLPKILSALPADHVLTVVGDGPDMERLRRAFGRLPGRVRFLGPLPPDAVSEILRQHDILLMPSRYEGQSMVLAEAMAAGCVPVVSRIRGVTDVVVEHGVDGRLFTVGDVRAAAREILQTARDLEGMAARAAAASARAGGVAAMGDGYAAAIAAARGIRPPAPPVPISAWSLPAGLRPGLLRRLVPGWLKNVLRTARGRMA